MYKLLIVEDEEIFRRVLPVIIDWNSIGFEIAGVVENGYKALSMLQQVEVDVILTDIRMPVLNGLELAMEVRSRYPKTKVLLLSAFNEFDYARKGIDCGVYGYLLKSDGEEEIVRYFSKLKTVLDAENKYDLPDDRILIQRRMIFKAISTKEMDNGRIILNEIKKLQIYHEPMSLAVTIFELDEYKSILGIWGIEHIHNMVGYIRNYLFKYVEAQKKGIVVCGDESICVLWTCADQGLMQSITEIFDGLKEELTMQTEKNDMYLTVTCAVGDVVDSVYEVFKSYELAKNALKHKAYLGCGQIIRGTELDKDSQVIFSFADEERWLKEILVIIQGDSSTKIVEFLDKLEQKLVTACSINVGLISGFSIKIIITVIQDIGRIRANTEELLTKSGYIIKEIGDCETITSIFKKLKIFLVECVVFLNEDKYTQNRKIVTEAVQYIEMNYSRQIGLEDVARYVNIHPVHLSRLFSKDLGKTFRSVLTATRIEAAKQLLGNINYKVYEISQLVGYEKPRYFSEVFRSMTGLTPLEYREKLVI